MSEYHEPYELLTPKTRELHRAIKSLMEELEAVDWYQQRVDVCTDDELKKILAHNRDEEIEHAVMTLEWLRRNVPKWDEQLRTYLFQDEKLSIVEIEHAAEHGGKAAEGGEEPATSASGSSQDLGIGSLKEE